MAMTIASLGYGIGAIAAYAVIGLVLMLAGFYVIDWTTPGKLSQLVREGRPNAAVVTASGLFSLAFIVVVAIYYSPAKLSDGLLTSLVFGLVGIVAQVLVMRVFEFAMRMDIGAMLAAEKFTPASIVVAAANVALGLVVAVAVS
ncbi:membrane protein [Kutzneria sp. 744]|nr:membrane protein [Kutzneria sp. 744]